MMSSVRISYTAHPATTPEAETYALANIYRFVLDCREKKAAAPTAARIASVRNTEEVNHVERRPS
jgi:hypothetical protein